MTSIAVALLGSLLSVAPVSAGSKQTDDASERLYLLYCSSCHGTGGKGDGALAPVLDVHPSDLTQIAKQNGGTFPYSEVFRSIDGRKSVRAHGTADMPVWGDVFLAGPTAPLSAQLEGAGKLFLITAHLETLQEK
ncbi:MAG: cytochrome c [Deltaproteobacteria bacterium]|nr:cytochrome c [Deltaproteobacteria bacterium]